MGVRRNPPNTAALGGQDIVFIGGAELGINAATANGIGTTVDVEGYNGAIIIDVWNTGTGSATFAVEGTDDQGVSWWGIGVDVMATGTAVSGGSNAGVPAAAGSLTRAANIALAASGSAGAAQRIAVLDPAVQMRCRISATSGTIAVTAQLIAIGA
jgi:hypothetical protein